MKKTTNPAEKETKLGAATAAAAATTTTWVKRQKGTLSVFTNLNGHKQQQQPPFSPATRQQRNRGPVDLDDSFSVSNRSRTQFLPVTEQDVAGVDVKKEQPWSEDNRNGDEGRSDNIITKWLNSTTWQLHP